MDDIQRGLSLLTKTEREKAINDIIAFFLDERGEEIGVVAAGNVLDFFEKDISPRIYNRTLDDVRDALKQELEAIDYKLSELRR